MIQKLLLIFQHPVPCIWLYILAYEFISWISNVKLSSSSHILALEFRISKIQCSVIKLEGIRESSGSGKHLKGQAYLPYSTTAKLSLIHTTEIVVCTFRVNVRQSDSSKGLKQGFHTTQHAIPHHMPKGHSCWQNFPYALSLQLVQHKFAQDLLQSAFLTGTILCGTRFYFNLNLSWDFCFQQG